MISPSDVICDVFAGIGPFAIRAAKQGCRVIANDLNPFSYKYLVENARRNKVAGRFSAFNSDAREFLARFLEGNREENHEERLESPDVQSLPSTFTHLYMNLPMDALEFLDVLQGRFRRDVWKVMPMVHVYGFAHMAGPDSLIERIKQVWGEFDSSGIKLVRVRDVSPRKFMYCVEFVMPEEIAFTGKRRDEIAGEEIIQKRAKVQEQDD